MEKHVLVLAFVVLALSGCVEQSNSGKYFEVVYSDPDCLGEKCFDEFIVLEDGLVFSKIRFPGRDYSVSFCSTPKEKASEMFSFLDASFEQSRLIECNSCDYLHLFYNNGTRTFYSSIPANEQVFEREVYDRATGLCQERKEAELVHLIVGTGSHYIDYHIFSNNIVVFEKFGLKEGELLESKVSKITPEEFAEFKSLISEDFFNSSPANNCPANGYFYGYVEALVEGKHNAAFSCGDEGPVGKAFLNLAGSLLE